MSRRVPLIIASVASACATVPQPLPRAHEVRAGDMTFAIRYADGDEPAASAIAGALWKAESAVSRWGRFHAPVIIRIQPTHVDLEQAAGRRGYPWLRAWARSRTIDFQSPRTWTGGSADSGQILELLTHELTHCLVYQQVRGTEVPLWFLEGLASVTAGQEHRASPRELSDYLRDHPGRDLLRDADALYPTAPGLIYGSGHRAMRLLQQRHGDTVPAAILSAMGRGEKFRDAFQRAASVSEQDYWGEFDRYVRSGEWRTGASDGQGRSPVPGPNPTSSPQ